MSENILKAGFFFDDSDGVKIDALRAKLLTTNNDFNNLGNNSTFGKTVGENFDTAGKSVDTFKSKFDNLKTQTESQSFKPTISRYWETEANQVTASVKKAETAIDGLTNKTYAPGQPLGFTLPSAEPSTKPAFADAYKSGFDDIDARLQKTQSSLQKLAQTRGDRGQFDTIYQGAFAAEKKINDLTNRVRALRKEAADPANAQFGKQYAQGIREAEKELSRLEVKQSSLSRSAGASGGRGRKGLGEAGRAILEVADDFVPAGFNKPFNAVVKELAKIEALSIATLGPLAAIAAIGYGIVKWSESVKETAERRLKYEEQIAVAVNKQVLGAKELNEAFERQRQFAAEDRTFGKLVQGDSVEELTRKRDLLLQLKKNATFDSVNAFVTTPDTAVEKEKGRQKFEFAEGEKSRKRFEELQQRYGNEILTLEGRLSALRDQKTIDQDKAFAQNFENRKKAEEADRLAQQKAAEKRTQEAGRLVEKIKSAKIEYVDFIGSARLNDNPFVQVLSDIETTADRAQKKFRVLGDEFVKAAEKADRANLEKKLGLLRYQTESDALRFDQEARRTQALQPTQFASFQRAVELVSKSVDFISQSGNLNRQVKEARFYADTYNPNNPKSFAEFNRRGASDDISDFGVQIRAAVEDIKNLNQVGLEGTGIYGRGAIADKILSLLPNRSELLKRLQNPATRGDAQFLLDQQAGALTTRRDFEQTKFNDFIESQKNLEFNKQFAREQIALLDRQTGLDKAARSKAFLDIVNPLGDDTDVNLQRRKYQANLEASAAKRSEEKEALEAWKAAAKYTAKINENLEKIITANGLKIDPEDLPATNVNVNVKDADVVTRTKTLGKSMTPDDMIGAVFGL